MSKPNKDARPSPRLPRGLRDIEAAELRQQQDMLAKIRAVYERYGFEPLETPAIEYTDALGKFLPDLDRPNEGVFSFQDEDDQWLSLRYDLTAPLARYVAEGLKSRGWRCLSAATPSAPCGATRSRAPAASASSCNSTPTRWAPRASQRMPRCACSPPTPWKRSAFTAAST